MAYLAPGPQEASEVTVAESGFARKWPGRCLRFVTFRSRGIEIARLVKAAINNASDPSRTRS